MANDEQPALGAFDALRARFELQSRRAQAYYTVMHAMRGVTGNDDAAHAWMNTPLPAFEGKTPAALVSEGREAELLGFIASLGGARR